MMVIKTVPVMLGRPHVFHAHNVGKAQDRGAWRTAPECLLLYTWSPVCKACNEKMLTVGADAREEDCLPGLHRLADSFPRQPLA